MIELLNELRIALPGVQILIAFLLTVPFTSRFDELSDFQRDVFYLTLVMAMLSSTCLVAPSAAHRVRFHQSDRAWLIESANKWMLSGLILLAIALTGVVLLITDLLYDGARVWVYTGLIASAIVAAWFVRPLISTIRGVRSGP